MIDVVKVAKAVRKIMKLSQDDTFDIMPTVSVACAQLTDRLKKAESSNDPRVINAAVYLSYYRLLLRNAVQDDTPASFKAGDVTISQSPALALEKASVLRDESIIAAAPLLEDMDFVFRQV